MTERPSDDPPDVAVDKRAVKAFEALLEQLAELAALCGKLRSLEQIVLRCADAGDPNALDRTGLESYIQALRSVAPRVLEP